MCRRGFSFFFYFFLFRCVPRELQDAHTSNVWTAYLCSTAKPPPIGRRQSKRKKKALFANLNLIKRVVVRADTGVVHLFEAHDDRVTNARLIHAHHLTGVVEPVRLRSQDLHLRSTRRADGRRLVLLFCSLGAHAKRRTAGGGDCCYIGWEGSIAC